MNGCGCRSTRCHPDRLSKWSARPDEFDRIYDVVDAAFGTKRPRAVYNWLYRENPNGLARCWIVRERATGMILKTGAGYPWPIWHDDEVLRGSIGGDAWRRRIIGVRIAPTS